MALLDEIGSHLEALAAGTLGADLFLGLLPDAPDACAALFETPGGPPSTFDAVEMRSVQLRVRDTAYPDARSRCETLYRLLHGLHDQALGGARYLLIRAKQPPFSLGRDEKQRHELACNFTVYRESPDR